LDKSRRVLRIILTQRKASEVLAMKNEAILRCMLAGALAISVASPTFAQSTLGGAKTPQNKIGGAAKAAPVVGGANLRTSSPPAPPKPGVTATATKPGSAPASPGIMPSGQTHAAGNVRPNPPAVTSPNRSATIANLKCASGACTARGGKP
jgi:hypothetical protein